MKTETECHKRGTQWGLRKQEEEDKANLNAPWPARGTALRYKRRLSWKCRHNENMESFPEEGCWGHLWGGEVPLCVLFVVVVGKSAVLWSTTLRTLGRSFPEECC